MKLHGRISIPLTPKIIHAMMMPEVKGATIILGILSAATFMATILFENQFLGL